MLSTVFISRIITQQQQGGAFEAAPHDSPMRHNDFLPGRIASRQEVGQFHRFQVNTRTLTLAGTDGCLCEYS